ncbi:MAG: ribonuclease BN, partial [Frankiaceae bacterium]|nr:ribonuclease BN [Frankiaceae bacterium]
MDIEKLKRRVDDFQQRHRATAFAYAVVKKFGEDSSSNLAVLITYYLFFSIFPLLLALSSILGFVLKHHPSWQTKVDSTV